MLLDCGPGVATALSGSGGARALTAVAVTHLHLDHCYDLLPVGKAPLYAGVEGVPLFVPEGARAVLERLAALFPVVSTPRLDRAFESAFDVREYRPGATVEVGDCELRFHKLRHVVPNCGVRVTAPTGILAYPGDTGVTSALGPLAGGADLLLAEATLDEPDRGDHGHLCAADAGRVAGAAGVGQLVLTQYTSEDGRRQDAWRHYGGPVLLARPGAVFPVCDGPY